MAVAYKVELNNPRLLSWARETAGYSIDEIAEQIKKSPETIIAWESGNDAPTYRQLEAFAERVRRPIDALFLPDVPREPPLPHDYRTLPGIEPGDFKPKTRFAIRQLRCELADLRELLNELGIDIVYSLPKWDITDNIDARANELRSLFNISVEDQLKWNDPYSALDNWRSILFDYGVYVRIVQIPISDARAFCLNESELAGIGISSKDLKNARIFSLFHEVYHLCVGLPGVSGDWEVGIHNSSTASIEQNCDSFAAAFLLPTSSSKVKDALSAIARDFTLISVQELAKQFKVSKYVIARRALDCNYITRSIYFPEIESWRLHDRQIASKMNDLNEDSEGGPNYYITRISHIGKRYMTLVFSALDQNKITSYDVSRLLSIKPEQFDKFRQKLKM